MNQHAGVEYITVGEARQRLCISKVKMAQLIRDGVLPTRVDPLNKRFKWVRVSDVDALMSSALSPKTTAVAA